MLENIFVINLAEHQERWELTQNEFKRIGISNYNRFEAIKCNNGKTLQDREMGCKLSHLRLIEKAKKENYTYITIFEDDIILKDDFIKKIKYFDDYLEWDMFYLGGNTRHNRGNILVKFDFIAYAKNVSTTHAYIIHSRCYDMLIRDIEINKTFPVDAIYRGGIQRQGNCYIYFPAIVTQRTGFSYIRNQNRDYSNWIK